MSANGKPSRHRRGYRTSHEARRHRLEPLVASGAVTCCRCGELIEPCQPWHLDHRDERDGYLGPSHATCNLRAAAIKRNGTSNTKPPLIWSRQWGGEAPPGRPLLLHARLYNPGERLDNDDFNIV